MSFLINNFSTSSFSATMTIGSSTVSFGDPKGGGSASTAKGYGNGEASYGSFGSMTLTTFSGFTIVAIYQADSSGTTVMELSGDAHTLSPVLRVAGVNQNLGAGTFSVGVTTFTGTATDPFGGSSVAITIV